MLTTRPQPRCFMPGTKAALTRNTLSRLIDSTRRQSANFIWSKASCGKMPAQLTTMSQRPNFFCTSAAIAATDCSDVTSHWQASAWRPACSTIFTVASAGAMSAMAM